MDANPTKLLVNNLEWLELDYFITGSVAAAVFGESRFTNDIDTVVILQPKDISRFCDAFDKDAFVLDRLSVERAIHEEGMFNLFHPESGWKVDVILFEDSDFNESRFARRRRLLIAED